VACGNVSYGGNVNPPRNRKSGTGNPPPTAARVALLPDTGTPRRSVRFRIVSPEPPASLEVARRPDHRGDRRGAPGLPRHGQAGLAQRQAVATA
jgi:hypothetical protein